MSRPLLVAATFLGCACAGFALGRALMPRRLAAAPAPRPAGADVVTYRHPAAGRGAAPRPRVTTAASDNGDLLRALRGHGAGFAGAWPATFNELILRIHILGAGPDPDRQPMLDCIHGDAESLVRVAGLLDSGEGSLRFTGMQVVDSSLADADRACLEALLALGVEVPLTDAQRPEPPLHIGLVVPLVLDPRDALHEHGRLGDAARDAGATP